MNLQKDRKSKAIDFDELVQMNVEAIARIEQAEHENRSAADVVSDVIAGFCGSPSFIWAHCVLFAVWLLWNTTALGVKVPRFDPPPFNMLTLVVSLEAIFLSTFILISQNRQQRIADQRNRLDLQINLLAEQESSRILAMLKRIMNQLNIPVDDEKAVEALQQATDPERVAEHIQNAELPEDRTADGKGDGA